MDKKEFTNIDMVAKFSKFQVINKDFTRCRCNVFYTGRNRNYSDITENALKKFIARKGYANVPVVAHLMKDDDGNYYVGGHDRKIIVSNAGIDLVDETIPFGVIPEDCNPSMDMITERSGEQREYFSVDVILWTHRYPIMEASYGDEIYFNQSMEINFDIGDYEYDGDYTVIKDFSMSALCLLNKSNNSKDNIEPCFESSVVKKFSVDEGKFKQNFELMLQTLKKYEAVESNNSIMKGEIGMDKSNIAEKLSEFTFQNILGETVSKYVLIDVTDTSVGVIDREDNKSYSFNWTANVEDVVIDFDNKKECVMTYRDFAEGEVNVFDYAKEIGLASDTASKFKESQVAKSFAEEYTTKINEVTTAYAQLKSEYDTAIVELENYRKVDAERLKAEKHAQVDSLLDTYAKKIGKLAEFLCYRASVDYSKDIEDIQRDLTIMAGKAMMDKNKGQEAVYSPTSCGVSFSLGNSKVNKYAQEDRYGDLLSRVMNK